MTTVIVRLLRWAKLEPKDRSSWRPSDLAVHPMVLNIGRRPTMEVGGEGRERTSHMTPSWYHLPGNTTSTDCHSNAL